MTFLHNWEIYYICSWTEQKTWLHHAFLNLIFVLMFVIYWLKFGPSSVHLGHTSEWGLHSLSWSMHLLKDFVSVGLVDVFVSLPPSHQKRVQSARSTVQCQKNLKEWLASTLTATALWFFHPLQLETPPWLSRTLKYVSSWRQSSETTGLERPHQLWRCFLIHNLLHCGVLFFLCI